VNSCDIIDSDDFGYVII